MPRVPGYDPQVRDSAMPGQRVDGNAPIEAFGGGASAAKVGEAASGLMSKLQGVLKEEKEKADDAFVQDLHRKAQDEKNRLMYGDPDKSVAGSEQGLMARKGQDSFKAMGEYTERYKKFNDDLEKSAKNDEQRAIFRKIRNQQESDLNDSANRHVFAESQEFQVKTAKAAIDSDRDDAVLNYQKVGVVEDRIARQQATAANLLQKQGIHPDSPIFKDTIKDIGSKTHSAVIERMIKNGDDRGAKIHYETFKDQLGADDMLKLEAPLRQSFVENESQRQATAYMASAKGDVGKAVAAARESIKDMDVQKETIKEIKVRFAENEAIDKQREEATLHRVINLVDKTGQRPDALTFASLKPEAKRQVDAWIEHRRKGTEPKTDDRLYYDLRSQASTPELQKKFMQTDLLSFRDRLSNKDWETLIDTQTKLRAGDPAIKKTLDGYRSTKDIVDDTMRGAGMKSGESASQEQNRRADLFRRRVDESVSEWKQQNGKADIPTDEAQKIVDRLMIKVRKDPATLFGVPIPLTGSEKPSFEVEAGEEYDGVVVPPNDRALILREMQKRGLQPTEKSIEKWYLKGKAAGRPKSGG